ncbi:MAG: hypothetical protein JSS02_06845 [Planctomycetes bacterium]|nr:hypothetical protein [Planctomycetota bacterium]
MPLRLWFALLVLVVPSVSFGAQTVKNGTWSDPAIWDVPPSQDEDVVIQHAVVVNAAAQARQVTVNLGATLTVANTLELWGSLIIYGSLEGRTGEIRFHVADDTKFTGNLLPTDAGYNDMDFYPNDIGIWGFGEAHLNAPEVTSWTNALPVVSKGVDGGYGTTLYTAITGTSATLDRIPNGWQVGDHLVLCALDGSYAEATLVSINGAKVTFKSKTPDFTAPALAVTDGSSLVQKIYPKVANLSRRFVISSADVVEGDSNHRAHVAMMMGGCAQFDFVEFRNLGPRAKLGRYPMHFHEMGDTPCCHVNGCSMWQSVSDPGNRFISVHQSSSVKVTYNVGLRSRGNGFFSENGIEANNQWIGNLSIDVSSPEEIKIKNARNDAGAHHFWLYDGSVISGNVGVGPKTVPGATLPPANQRTVGMILLSNLTGLSNVAPPVIANCEFLGTGEYAVWSLVDNTQINNPKAAYCGTQFNHDTGYPTLDLAINNPVLVLNGSGGVSPYRCQFYFNSGLPTARNISIVGGSFAGEILIHSHYHAVGLFQGTRLSGKYLMNGTYFQCMLMFQGCTFNTGAFQFQNGYGPHQEEPGLVSIRNCTGNLFGKYSASAVNIDFSMDDMSRFPGFAGQAEATGVWRLRSLAPTTGIISRPPTGDKYPQAEFWSVVVAGQPAGPMRKGDPFRFTEPAWTASQQAGTRGYPYGFPPGTYDVRITQGDGTVKTYRGVKVQAGKVTQMK